MKKIDWNVFLRVKVPVIIMLVAVACLWYGVKVGFAGEDSSLQEGEEDFYVPMGDGLLASVFPEADSYRMIDTLHGELLGTYGQKVGMVLYSGKVAPDIYGYGGKLPLYIVLDPNSVIRGVVLGRNHESPSYARRLYSSHFMDTWNGLCVDSALAMEPDALSGCTYSSGAVIAAVEATLEAYTRQGRIDACKVDPGESMGNLLSLMVVVLGLYFCFFPSHSRPYLFLMYVASVAILGLWRAQMLSVDRMYAWVVSGVNITSAVVFVMFILAILIPLFTGKAFYCSYVCPYGAAQSLLYRLPTHKWQIPEKAVRYLRYVQPVLLLGIVIAALFPGVDTLVGVEVFSGFRYQAASAWVLSLFSLFLFLSIFINRPWCRYFCPTGYLLRLCQQGFRWPMK